MSERSRGGGESSKPDLLALVDATSGDWDDMGLAAAIRVGVLSKVRDITGTAIVEDDGFWDPYCLRWHDMQKETPSGDADRRMSITTVNDYEGVYSEVEDDVSAPFGQTEVFDVKNRSTRERDLSGRVALPGSHRKIVDSEDGLYALAQTFVEIEIGSSSSVSGGTGSTPEIPGVVFREAGTTSGTGGSVTTTQPFVAVNGLSFFGDAAISAAREAANVPGAEAIDVARAASAAARGLPPPPPRTRTRPPNESVTKPAELDPIEDCGPPISPKPGGYLWNGTRVGLLGTIYSLEGEFLDYFTGVEGTPIGAAAIRHDAKFYMAPDHVGRIKFVDDDVSQVKVVSGRLFKGAMYRDTSLANSDTDVCGETNQWRPAIRVDAKIPAGDPPPPPEPPPWVQPPPEDEGPGLHGPPQDPEEITSRPRGGGGSGDGGGVEKKEPTGVGIGNPPEPKKLVSTPFSGGDGKPPEDKDKDKDEEEKPRGPTGSDPGDPVTGNPVSQERDFEGPGVACPNTTAGEVLKGDPNLLGGVTNTPSFVSGVSGDPDGAVRSFYGYPAINQAETGYRLGGFEAAPSIAGAAAGVAGASAVVGAGTASSAIVDILTPEQAEKAQTDDRRAARDARTQARRDRRDERRSDRIIELQNAAALAKKAGNDARAKRLKKAADRELKRQERIDDRREEADGRKQRARDRHDARVARAKDAKARKRARQKRANDAARSSEGKGQSGADVQGGYVIDTTDGGSIGSGGVGVDLPPGTTDLEGGGTIPTSGGFVPTGGSFNSWNVVNSPVPYMGSAGGAATVEGQIHRMTATLQGVQSVVMGLAGGPSYFAGSVAAVDTSRPGKQVSGHMLGTKNVSIPGYAAQVVDKPAVHVKSIIDSGDGQRIVAAGAGLLEVTREHRAGGGSISDKRPLVALHNDLGAKGGDRGDLIEERSRRYLVDGFAGQTAAKLSARWQPTDPAGHVFSAGAQNADLSDGEEWAYIDSGGDDTQGMLVGNKGMGVTDGPYQARNGQAVDLYEPLAAGELQADALPKYRLRALASNAGMRIFVLDSSGNEVSSPRITFGEGGTVVDGDLTVNGDIIVSGLIR